LGQLSASVAHEINNPLSGVLNLSMLMQRILKDDGIPPGRVEEFRKYLSQIITETSRVGRIVSDLLAFSRRSKPQSANADLNSIIKTTVSLVSHKLKLGNVDVQLDLEAALPLLRCDSSQIQQVVMNLVLNGAEATHGKGKGAVKIRTRSDKKEGLLVFEVEDNGEGMPPERIAKIFDPFFTTKPEGKGVGLGLAVVYGIVDSHGGDIAVSSKVGEGTRFKVTLPIAGGEPDAAQAAAAGAAKG
jgi:two-component system NtrC family sensor kinase